MPNKYSLNLTVEFKEESYDLAEEASYAIVDLFNKRYGELNEWKAEATFVSLEQLTPEYVDGKIYKVKWAYDDDDRVVEFLQWNAPTKRFYDAKGCFVSEDAVEEAEEV